MRNSQPRRGAVTTAPARRRALLATVPAVLGSCLIALVACQKAPQPSFRPPITAAVAKRQGPAPDVELGFRLFFDPILSRDNSVSCASCHRPGQGFSNGEAVATGINGQKGARNTPTIYAAARNPHQFWDGRASSLEEQALGPIVNPIEMGASLDEVEAKLRRSPRYVDLFQRAYGTPPDRLGLAKAIASFERALKAEYSPFDRFLAGDATALTEAQRRGWDVFRDRGRCIECHQVPDFDDHRFHNLGVGTDKPNPDVGRFAVTGKPADWASFKTPTLRNITKTAPYMHDGSIQTLDEVVRFYDRGGLDNPHLDPKIRPIHLMRDEREDLLAFLDALTSRDNLQEIAPSPAPRR